MISKLKRKLTILATISMLALMAVLLLIMNIVNFTSVVRESDMILDMLSQTNSPFNDKGGFREDKPNEHAEDFVPRGMSPEVPYEARYFSVTVNENGDVSESDLSRIITVDSTSANTYIEKAINSKKERGFIGEFRFAKTTDNVGTRIIFLDCGRKLDAFETFFWTSIIVGLFGCLIVFVAFLFISGRIVKPIAESYEKQKRFISDAGHEIKTPLTIISANVDLLECDGEKEELSEIRNQAKRLTELTNNLVCLSKMEESASKQKKVLLPLSDTVAEAANPFSAVASANETEFRTDIQPNISINGSPDSIRQLVSILIENAVKYSQSGGQIFIGLKTVKKTAVLTVFNTTKEQVNPKDLPRVFDRFYRTDASRNSETGGHGIGLSIAKAITELHDGSISALTQSGYDFTIVVELPLSSDIL